MSKPANTSLIGAFVLGGLLLLTVGIGLFGAGQFNAKKVKFICFFEDSVNGLDIGSPVKFKGVNIGKVAQVLLRTRSQNEGDNAVPVIIEIDEKMLASRGIVDHLVDAEKRKVAIEKGLRARLQQLSIITGMLYVEMDFYPNALVNYHKRESAEGLIEVPTITSNLGTLVRAATQTIEQFSQIQFAAMGEKVNRILSQVEEGIGAVDFNKINQGVIDVTASANDLLKNPDVQQAPGNLTAALKSFQDLSKKLEAQVDPLTADMRKTTEETRVTLNHINRAVDNLRLLIQPGTGLRGSLDETLQQIADAAQAIRTLANYLERNPNVVITGKAEEDHPREPARKK